MSDLISVCIATYKRPELLEKLLISLINQKNIDNYNLEFVIVDNDPARTAKPIIDKLIKSLINNNRFSIKYDMQPIKNISLTRNRTIQLASGNYLYFIDDDEIAEEDCIYQHIKTLKKFEADITIGNVLPYFETDTPSYIKKAYPFIRKNNSDGNPSKFFITGNTMIVLKNLQKEMLEFNKAYGVTGGSDNELLVKLSNSGTKIVSCSSGITFEFIPPKRATAKWLIKRVFRTGNNYSRTLIKTSRHKFFYSIQQFLIGVIQALIAFLIALIFIPFNFSKAFNWFLKSVSNFAKPFAVFGIYPKEYR